MGFGPAPNDRVRELPDRRTVRYYATLGLLDRPTIQGRTAFYGRRHLLQLATARVESMVLRSHPCDENMITTRYASGLSLSSTSLIGSMPLSRKTRFASRRIRTLRHGCGNHRLRR